MKGSEPTYEILELYLGLVSQEYDGGTLNTDIQAHPRRIKDNDGEIVEACHVCGQDYGMWEVHAYEI
jgi:hypothetical protein